MGTWCMECVCSMPEIHGLITDYLQLNTAMDLIITLNK